MGTFFVYVLKSSVCLAMFYLFFRILLSKETFHRFNRIALLGILFLSLLLPWVEVTTGRQMEVRQTMLTLEHLLQKTETTSSIVADEAGITSEAVSLSWVEILLFVYGGGIVFFTCCHLYSLVCLFRLIRSGRQEKWENGTILVVHRQAIAPFSWMKYIVISRKDLEENGREILIHEAAHIRHRHSIDLLIADVCVFFQWFNPGAWLLKQELQNIHEYEADETVINEGVNAKDYQLLLIKKAVGTRLYSMANSFNHSKLKKRITMMLKEKSSPWARMKYLYVLPLAAVAVTAFARPEISEKVEEISAVKVNDLVEIVQEKVLQDSVRVPKKAVSTKAVCVGGNAESAKEEVAVFVAVEQMPEYPGGMEALQKYLEERVAGSPVKGEAGGVVTIGFTVTETGKVTNVQVLESDQPSLNKEAERIVSEMPDWIPGKQRGKPVSVKYSVPVRFGNIRFGWDKQQLILVDGKEISMNAMKKMNPSEIESVSVLKDSASVRIYGKRGENGVILVTTKKSDTTTQCDSPKVDNQENVVPDFQVSGTVVDEQGRPKAGVSILVPNTTYGTITYRGGHFSLKAIKGGSLLFSFTGYKSVKVPVSATMSVRMEQEVVKLLPETTSRLTRIKSTGSNGLISGSSVHGIKNGEEPLIIIDGKEALEKDALSKLAPDHIKSLSILKDKSATAVYGEKGKDGVIIIEMLTDEEFQAKKNNPKGSYANAWQLAEHAAKDMLGEVIYLLDGKEVHAGILETMSAESIKTASAENVDGKVVIRLVSKK
ncbi:M56 family metallopeptidase [Bacteroides acidifaciens]|uniref:M56 family metallopeptidase n=1 Tax=Bacteroides acidifaciens TaxID=85831 RepID=UPI002558284D|nr:M56 family metallopeptidase [Bacteroides acidifaciens]